jgi:hypothetical protein
MRCPPHPTPHLACLKSMPHDLLCGLVIIIGIPEIKRTETSRTVIFENVRLGFAAAFDALTADPEQKGKGYEVAKKIWSDDILAQMSSVQEDTRARVSEALERDPSMKASIKVIWLGIYRVDWSIWSFPSPLLGSFFFV